MSGLKDGLRNIVAPRVDRRPIRAVRAALFVVGLVILAGSYAVADSELVPTIAILSLAFGLIPAVIPRLADRFTEPLPPRAPSRGAVLLTVGVALVLGLLLLLVPDTRLGVWFWWWLIMGVVFELVIVLEPRADSANASRW